MQQLAQQRGHGRMPMMQQMNQHPMQGGHQMRPMNLNSKAKGPAKKGAHPKKGKGMDLQQQWYGGYGGFEGGWGEPWGGEFGGWGDEFGLGGYGGWGGEFGGWGEGYGGWGAEGWGGYGGWGEPWGGEFGGWGGWGW